MIKIKSPTSLLHTLAAILLLPVAFAGSAHGAVYTYTGAVTTGTLAPGTYYITASGGAGGGSNYGVGGYAALIGGQFTLSSTTSLTILVGQEGGYGTGIHGACGGGGGGGTFVLTGTVPLVIAGGGGGNNGYSSGGGAGQTSTAGGNDGGTDGSGGSAGDNSGGGGGLLTSGSGSNGGESYFAGAAGGTGAGDGLGGSSGNGGFGGGGAGGAGLYSGGGGGGYSGGSGGGTNDSGGGGGSLLSPDASNPLEIVSDQIGDGYVKIVAEGVVDNVLQGTAIVAKGDPVPGVAGALFSLADSPAVDSSGEVVFKAFITGTGSKSGISSANNSGIWFYSGTTGTLLARTGTNATGTTGAVFKSLSDPAMDYGASIAYGGTLKGGDVTKNSSNAAGIWLVQTGSTGLYARTGGTVAGQSAAAYKSFEQVVTENPYGLAFLTTLSGSGVKSATNMALCGVDLNHNLSTVLRTGTTLVTGTTARIVKSINVFGISTDEKGQNRGMDPLNGYLAFGIDYTDGISAIALASRASPGFDLESTADTSGTSVPGVRSAKWEAFGNPAVNDSAMVAFRGTLKSLSSAVKITGENNSGIWLDSIRDTTLIARTSGASPGTRGAVFSALQEPVLNNNGAVAFIGTLANAKGLVSSGSSQGIWTTVSGSLSLVARTGEAAPEVTGTFSSFEQIVLPDLSGPIFLASLKGAPHGMATGLWGADTNGQLHLVVQTGNEVEVHGVPKTIESFSIFAALPEVSGQSRSFDAYTNNITFLANFTDHTWAVVQAQAP